MGAPEADPGFANEPLESFISLIDSSKQFRVGLEQLKDWLSVKFDADPPAAPAKKL